MSVLETAPLRFERLQLCYPVSSQTGYGRGCQIILTIFVREGLLHLVSADVAVIHSHEVNVCNVIHKKEELGLCLGRLCNHLMHLLERRHVWSIVCKSADDVAAKVFSALFSIGRRHIISYQSEKHGRVSVCEIEGCKHYEWTFAHVKVVAFVSQVSFVAIGERNVFGNY